MKYDYTDVEFMGACEHIARNKERFEEVRRYIKEKAQWPKINRWKTTEPEGVINTQLSFIHGYLHVKTLPRITDEGK